MQQKPFDGQALPVYPLKELTTLPQTSGIRMFRSQDVRSSLDVSHTKNWRRRRRRTDGETGPSLEGGEVAPWHCARGPSPQRRPRYGGDRRNGRWIDDQSNQFSSL